MHALNQSLQTEIHERRRIERELRAQRELFKSVAFWLVASAFVLLGIVACVFRSHLNADSDGTRAPIPMPLERSFRRT